MKKVFLVPLLLFGLLAVFLSIGLKRDPRELPSQLIGKPAPAFTVPQLSMGEPLPSFSPADMHGKVWMLNVWASWCVACREEHPVLLEFARTATLPIVGLDYKDQDADARRWLKQYGNPYTLTAIDAPGRVGIDYGVYGVPETYLIDKNGVVRYKRVGPVTRELLQQTLLPLIKELQQ